MKITTKKTVKTNETTLVIESGDTRFRIIEISEGIIRILKISDSDSDDVNIKPIVNNVIELS